ncbi:copper homeostasis membrane protein CopD [Kosakonia sp.]|uniref:copper homeostasis membrane protein CopD n=1 Tax=Kosakonia sp. TaxID=1916651 RepID=UPI002898BD2C|nr:copper homeostasis membrane protein CopD [Kosakonia sp.]
MLAESYVWLRFVHFAVLIVIFGSALFSSWLAPHALRRLLAHRFMPLQQMCLWLNIASAVLMFMVQGGMMGEGWQDVWRPEIWLMLTGTQFGSVWSLQMLLACLTLIVALLQPGNQQRLLLLVTIQFMLSAGTGHAAMHDGLTGVLQRGNHFIHLICAATWLGGLLPVLFCMQLAHGRWREAAIAAMMRFSRYGHLAVAGVLMTGIINTLFIQGLNLPWHSAWGRLLLLKCALVVVMVAIALVNRYVLVPRLSLKNDTARQRFISLTWAEVGLGALVLAAVSLFATWEPF